MASRLSEFDLIAKCFRPLATHPGALSLGDDAAVLAQAAGRDLVVTSDALTAGVHFFADDLPERIAAKALRVNLSDLAAKGAVPVGYLLALALPHTVDDAWMAAFSRGLAEDQSSFGVSLLGGDTTATPGPLTVAITAIGEVPHGQMTPRSGAKPGDAVFVSGTIGDAGAGLDVLQNAAALLSDDTAMVSNRYWLPTPRLRLGQALRGVASAALDVSDGLLADLGHIAEQSQVRIVVEADAVPLSSALRSIWPGRDGLLRAVTAGDDYEIAFTAPSAEAVRQTSEASLVPVTRIGRVEMGEGVAFVDGSGQEIAIRTPGFTHF